MLCNELNEISKYSWDDFVCGHQASSPANRAFAGYLSSNVDEAVMFSSGKSPFSNPSDVSLYLRFSAS